MAAATRDLVIGVLTGRRPDLLMRTVTSMRRNQADIWRSAAKVVVHNGGDSQTARILDRYGWDARVDVGSADHLMTIGEASQVLVQTMADTGAGWSLRLEDDFEATSTRWWRVARHLIEQDGARQVRLQLDAERVMSRCMVCRQPIRWRTAGTHKIGHAHYTHRASLMRTADLHALLPYRSEVHAGERMHEHDVAQHVPGVFSHIGVRGRSLRRSGGST